MYLYIYLFIYLFIYFFGELYCGNQTHYILGLFVSLLQIFQVSTFLRWKSTKSVRKRILCGLLGLFLGSDGHNCLFLIKVVI